MLLAVFSDVHGNLPALERMLADAGAVDGYVCLGDTVNYGPWSNECVDLVDSLPNLVSLRGNHEDYFLRGEYGGSNELARMFFAFCSGTFDRLESLRRLDVEYRVNDIVFSHTIGDRYIFPDTPVELDSDRIIGHTHRQFLVRRPPFFLCNSGSVGQNRASIDVIDYLLVETGTRDVRLRQLSYDCRLIINEMKARHYPAECVAYYENKPRRR
ncbi:metallophosphoesterase [Amycolatopsis acidiphila]|uniref:Metallophosphoesterase n=1 Tax=Amycolatopsis acidiphila TaxID=715473 RepID=A0A558AN35_9PSEU|nr:metallophosphoesterase [Amycolatopsis acidiphila]TVT25676.1 metallophosphoesterase [Amycolatopsis acidiphila]UIJ60432.1 metallophosphoesterase [Amycolatopsis acidiphila]GHG90201.1 metallophosphoesterase [Amycolatopsis acidiphila]